MYVWELRGGGEETTTDARWAGEVGKEKRGLAGGIGFFITYEGKGKKDEVRKMEIVCQLDW